MFTPTINDLDIDALAAETNKKRGRNNKSRGKVYERDVAKSMATTRYPADSGGPADLLTTAEGHVVQVKSGMRLVNATIRGAVDAARSAAGPAELGLAALISRDGNKLRRYIIVDFDEFLEWEGYNS